MKSVSWFSASLVIALFSTAALADDGGNQGRNGNNQNGNNNQNGQSSFSASMIGSTPGTMVGGVAAGGAPWVVNQGSAQVSSDGSLQVSVSGLLLGLGAPANLVGTVGPVQMVAASLICGGSGGTVVASTAPVFLSAAGNARIENTVFLPASCAAPAVAIRIFNPAAALGSQLGAFIATTGLSAATNVNNGNEFNNGNNFNNGRHGDN